MTDEDRDTGKHEQGQRVAESPGQAMLDDIRDVAAARRDRGDRRDVIGLERMLHAQQKSETQNTEHVPSLLPQAKLAVSLIGASFGPGRHGCIGPQRESSLPLIYVKRPRSAAA